MRQFTTIILILSIILFIHSDESELSYIDKIIDEYKKIGDLIVSKLKDETLWQNATYQKDRAKTEELLKYLKYATIINCEDIESVLVKHITYTPYEAIPPNRIIDKKELYPVLAVLKDLGLKAVNPLIEILKTCNSEKEGDKEASEITREFALECLIAIYEKGGFGKEMTKYRLQLELENSTGKEKELLQKALESSLLKD